MWSSRHVLQSESAERRHAVSHTGVLTVCVGLIKIKQVDLKTRMLRDWAKSKAQEHLAFNITEGLWQKDKLEGLWCALSGHTRKSDMSIA